MKVSRFFNSQLTTHNSQLKTQNSQLTTHDSRLTTHDSQKKRVRRNFLKNKRIEILTTLLYNLYMEEIKYLLTDFVDRFNAAEPPAKKQMINEGK